MLIISILRILLIHAIYLITVLELLNIKERFCRKKSFNLSKFVDVFVKLGHLIAIKYIAAFFYFFDSANLFDNKWKKTLYRTITFMSTCMQIHKKSS